MQYTCYQGLTSLWGFSRRFLYRHLLTYAFLQVIINSGFTQVVGTLEYQASTSKLYFPPIAIAGIVAGGSILVIIIIIILIIYRRKSTEADRQYKKMQVQLDTLESNVRNECKQGKSREIPTPPLDSIQTCP